MNESNLPIGRVPLTDRETYKRAGIELLDKASALLAAVNTTATLLPESRGLGRLLNLIQWQAEAHHEFFDGTAAFGDQIIHAAVHQAVLGRLGQDNLHAALCGEALASGVDLYLLGKFSEAGEEPDFLTETLESFGSYFEMYAAKEEDFESLLDFLSREPYGAMLQTTNFLYRFVCDLATGHDRPHAMARLLAQETNVLYPLVHHYNLSNWVLTTRGSRAATAAEEDRICAFLQDLQAGENFFLSLFDQYPASHRSG